MLLRSISGLRGTVGVDDSGLSAEILARYAASFARYNNNKGTVAVGYDGRLGGLRFYDIASRRCSHAVAMCSHSVWRRRRP